LGHDGSVASDEALLEVFLRGQESAFTELVRRHEDRIFALALKMTGNRSDALDATQDTFIQCFRQAAKFRGESAFGTWLYRIGINSCRDLLRKRKRLPALEDEVPEADPPSDRGPSIEDAVSARLDLRTALAALNEDYREAVALHDLGGVPYEEIATMTGVSIGTVKSRISRGRKRLAELLEQQGGAKTSKETK
jgi:RNA polymerase sigma-70 factor (ECF subfamily)